MTAGNTSAFAGYPQEGLEFPGGGRFCKTPKFLREFPEGWRGSKKKSLLWGKYGYFLELHIARGHVCMRMVELPKMAATCTLQLIGWTSML